MAWKKLFGFIFTLALNAIALNSQTQQIKIPEKPQAAEKNPGIFSERD
jgi:hypothetical protein